MSSHRRIGVVKSKIVRRGNPSSDDRFTRAAPSAKPADVIEVFRMKHTQLHEVPEQDNQAGNSTKVDIRSALANDQFVRTAGVR